MKLYTGAASYVMYKLIWLWRRVARFVVQPSLEKHFELETIDDIKADIRRWK